MFFTFRKFFASFHLRGRRRSFLATAFADLRGRRERTVVLEDIFRCNSGTGDRSKGKNFFEVTTILRITTDGDNRTAIKARG